MNGSIGSLAELDFGLNPQQKLRLALLIPAYHIASPGIDPIKVADAMVAWIREGKGSLEGLCNERRAAPAGGLMAALLNPGSPPSEPGTSQPN